MDVHKCWDVAINKIAELELEDRPKTFSLWQLDFRVKPTSHYAECKACGMTLVKGEKIVSIPRGTSHSNWLYAHYHRDCFLAALYIKLSSVKE